MSYTNYLAAVELINNNNALVKENATMQRFVQSIEDVQEAEVILGTTFPDSYKEFLITFSKMAFQGECIYGLGDKNEYQNQNYVYSNIICNTLDERKVNTDPPFPESFVVIYDLGDGEKFCLDTSKMNAEGECPVIAWYFGRIEPLYEDFGAFFLETVTEGLKSLEEDGNKVNW